MYEGKHRKNTQPTLMERVKPRLESVSRGAGGVLARPFSSYGEYYSGLDTVDKVGNLLVAATLSFVSIFAAGKAATPTAEDAFIARYITGGCLQGTEFDPSLRSEFGDAIGAVALPGNIDDTATLDVVSQMSPKVLSYGVGGKNFFAPLAKQPTLTPTPETLDILASYGCDLSGQTE